MATSNKKRSYTKKNTQKRTVKTRSNTRSKHDYELMLDIKILVIIAVSIFLFVCNFGLIGTFGNYLSTFFFGLFGMLNYAAPIFIAALIVMGELIRYKGGSSKKIVSLSAFFVLIEMIIDLIGGISRNLSKYSVKELYKYCSQDRKGGGIIAASLDYALLNVIDLAGTIIVIVVLLIISVIIFTDKSLITSVRDTHEYMREKSLRDRQIKEEVYEDRRKEEEERRARRRERLEEERRIKAEAERNRKEEKKEIKENEDVLKRNKKVKGVTLDTNLSDVKTVEPVKTEDNVNDDIHEINLNGFDPGKLKYNPEVKTEKTVNTESEITDVIIEEDDEEIIPGTVSFKPTEKIPAKETNTLPDNNTVKTRVKERTAYPENLTGEYVFPPRSLLAKGVKKGGDSQAEIMQTAEKLQETLAIFGVEATVTDVSQGPTVTRFELQPKMGVKVSRIKSLSDDIKLNLAASEIRIEAPIPGKAAIGIEVPNKQAQAVLFRDLIDSNEYNNFNSKLAFAVGKDITGKTIVYGIDSFPHLLIAGATGSGKSVCINTLIMSIIYKANPDDVKLIMIDPKVVELSVYNGIPHLMLPVVTDVKKAAATLNYAVNEMQERYKKFAEFGARDLSGYNRIVEENGEDSFNKKLPHLVIIVDEVADLMLQERKNVEDSICSLAQLARAAGIHLIIATQRPSVDVITGLIKANMPSRIAFAVSSNVDSRTILDMGGAEELLGKGDMLFFPKGLKKPVRLQGGFVSDKEVSDVVEFLRKQGTPSYDESIEEKIKSCEKKTDGGSQGGGFDGSGDGNDPLFADAGFFIIQENKASIGYLQRKFKIGFNRAARIMDQLADAGVVSQENGTKARDILMSTADFENYLEEYGG